MCVTGQSHTTDVHLRMQKLDNYWPRPGYLRADAVSSCTRHHIGRLCGSQWELASHASGMRAPPHDSTDSTVCLPGWCVNGVAPGQHVCCQYAQLHEFFLPTFQRMQKQFGNGVAQTGGTYDPVTRQLTRYSMRLSSYVVNLHCSWNAMQRGHPHGTQLIPL